MFSHGVSELIAAYQQVADLVIMFIHDYSVVFRTDCPYSMCRYLFWMFVFFFSGNWCFPNLFLAAHQHCAYSLSPLLSNTPDSTQQLIIRWVNELMS